VPGLLPDRPEDARCIADVPDRERLEHVAGRSTPGSPFPEQVVVVLAALDRLL
jgi:hypothetical protein